MTNIIFKKSCNILYKAHRFVLCNNYGHYFECRIKRNYEALKILPFMLTSVPFYPRCTRLYSVQSVLAISLPHCLACHTICTLFFLVLWSLGLVTSISASVSVSCQLYSFNSVCFSLLPLPHKYCCGIGKPRNIITNQRNPDCMAYWHFIAKVKCYWRNVQLII